MIPMSGDRHCKPGWVRVREGPRYDMSIGESVADISSLAIRPVERMQLRRSWAARLS